MQHKLCIYLQLLLLICELNAQANITKETETEKARKAFKNNDKLDGRIVGGWETSINFFPHQVSLQIGNTHLCGGAILDETTILTAAHCVEQFKEPQIYTVYAGSTELDSNGVRVRVRLIIPHEQYNEPTEFNNDIALVILVQELIFNVHIQPISLATYADGIGKQSTLFVSGWGATSSTQQVIQPKLRYTHVIQIDQQLCTRTYASTATVTETMMCAGSLTGGRDSCQGDSGGPLVASVNGRLKLVGIVSWGRGCAQSLYPGVYTRVTAYNSWVARHLLD